MTSSELIKLHGSVCSQAALFLVDSGATSCFVSAAFVARHRLQSTPVVNPVSVRLADGSLRTCTHQLVGSQAAVLIGDYFDDRLTFNILDLNGFDAVLGKTWLNLLNPQIDWPNNTLRFHH